MFQVNLHGLDLNSDQTRELEEKLTATTTEFLGSFKEGKAYLTDAVAYKPNPDDPDPWPWPWGPIVGPFPFPIPRPFPGFFPINRKTLDQNFQKIKF
jgi:hypothetical protein